MSFVQQYIKRNSDYLKRSAFFISIVFITVLIYQFFFTSISIEVELYTPKRNIFQVYYADKQQLHSEKQSCKFLIKPELTNYDFKLPAFLSMTFRTFTPLQSLKFIRNLRIDPMKKSGTIRIKRIVIKQNGYKPIRFETVDELKMWRPNDDVAKVNYQADGMVIFSSGRDPQLETFINPQIDFKFFFIVLALIISIDFGLNRLSGGAIKEVEFAYAPYLMIFICALILAGGAICKQMHADEGHHLQAGIYYMDHWLPPEVCDPSIAHTYSVYGVSRLDSSEIMYLIAGKFAKLIAWFPLSDFFRFRLFNIGLFFILTLLAIKNVEYRILCLPLLVSPQIWYIFTYFNSEAFALFIIILIAYQAASQKSMTHNYLTACKTRRETIFYPIALGLLFSLLLLVKLNFLVFAVFLLSVFLLKLSQKEYSHPLKVLQRVILIMLVAVSVLGVRYGIDTTINGFDKKEKCFECRKKLAMPLFNPATPLPQRHLYLRLKERGITLKEVFKGWDWGYYSFWRSFGAYFFEPPAPDWYLKVILTICILFALYLAGSVIIGLRSEQILLLLIVVLCSVLMIGLSVWNSWTASFQAHGRYLFPIFIMTGFLIFQSLTVLNKKCLNFFILLMFLLSSYSYLFVGLLQLPKL